MKKKDDNLKYLVKSNNYVGLLFFALVLASLLYILKSEEINLAGTKPEKETIKEINLPNTIYDETNDTIEEYRHYLNVGSEDTYKTYQSTYIKDGLKITDIDNESLLYMAYQYIITKDDYNTSRQLTCDEAVIAGIDNEIIDCGGNTYSLNDYKLYSKISVSLLKNTIRDLYNINITDFSSFYTNGSNMCYYDSTEYLCITNIKLIVPDTNYGVSEFIAAYEYDNTLEIVEKYHFIRDNISYKSINSNEVGEETYISIFKKTNGKYYYINTEVDK